MRSAGLECWLYLPWCPPQPGLPPSAELTGVHGKEIPLVSTQWHEIDRYLIGEAWAGSRIGSHLKKLCDGIGPRWASSAEEWRTIGYIREQFAACGLDAVDVEEYEMDTWSWSEAGATLEDGREFDLLPTIWCPSFDVEAPVVDVGFGTGQEISAAAGLPGAIAVMAMAHAPFATPSPHAYRLRDLAEAGAAAAVLIDVKEGGRKEYHSVLDLAAPDFADPPLPAVTVSREEGQLLRRNAGARLRLRAGTDTRRAPSANVTAELEGAGADGEHLVLGAHHDTVYGAPGGNDNTSGVIAVLETARVLSLLRGETGEGSGMLHPLCHLQRRGAALPGVLRLRRPPLRGRRGPRVSRSTSTS